MKEIKDYLEEFYEDKIECGLYTSKNECGNDVIIEITKDSFKISTLQDNGWTRINVYYKDHTIEEYYER